MQVWLMQYNQVFVFVQISGIAAAQAVLLLPFCAKRHASKKAHLQLLALLRHAGLGHEDI